MSTKTTNLNLIKPSKDDKYDININNGNLDIIDLSLGNLEKELKEKTNLYINETLPETKDRKQKTIYLKVTDTLNDSVSNDLKVSPYMGIKMI